MAAAILDVELWRGDNDPKLAWQLVDDAGQPFMEEGSVFVLTVTWRNGTIRKDSAEADGLGYDTESAAVTWSLSPDETAAIPKGRLAEYRLQRRSGTEHRTFVTGMVTARGEPMA